MKRYLLEADIYSVNMDGKVESLKFGNQIIRLSEGFDQRGNENFMIPENDRDFLLGRACYVAAEPVSTHGDFALLPEFTDRTEIVNPENVKIREPEEIEAKLLGEKIVWSTALDCYDMCEYLARNSDLAVLDDHGLIYNYEFLKDVVRSFDGESTYDALDKETYDNFEWCLDQDPQYKKAAEKHVAENQRFYAASSHGTVTALLDGRVHSLGDPEEWYKSYREDGTSIPAKFDIDEWQKAYPGEKLAGKTIDILDIGFTDTKGNYVPPDNDWRKEFGTKRGMKKTTGPKM